MPSPSPVNLMRIRLRGAVQGVGFRPFVYRLATSLDLMGTVHNSPSGATIEAEGPRPELEAFLSRLQDEKPVHCLFQSIEYDLAEPAGHTLFAIGRSHTGEEPTTLVLPDIATCGACRSEVLDPANRRYLYPFTNCTHCGPRYSILQKLPYDRANTSMKAFEMCARCRREYEDPSDRRFHAQPNACPQCGPQVQLLDSGGRRVASRADAVERVAGAVRDGRIVAVKGIGGFHLMVDAASERSVQELTDRKGRDAKPFALMVPDLKAVESHCDVHAQEAALLQSSEAPIVLLARRRGAGSAIADGVAPGCPCLGVMLPYSPLHHVLMKLIDRPVVATSANLAEEPICTSNKEALDRLGNVADLFLVHDRPILRPVDDSIVRVVCDRPLLIRRARGFAPLPIQTACDGPSVLAVGGQLKNTVAVTVTQNVFLSQHIGDLQEGRSFEVFRTAIEKLTEIHAPQIKAVACDLHPQYQSTQYAEGLGLPLIRVQHHHAHLVSCMAEHGLDGTVLGISFDGTGWGPDGTVWGGEFLRADPCDFARTAYLRPFRLPGGDRAIREPRRCALSVLASLNNDLGTFEDVPTLQSFSRAERRVLHQMIDAGLQAPWTSSAGRLFDAIASILGLCQFNSYEGQAAMMLEDLADPAVRDAYEFDVRMPIVDWAPMIFGVIRDQRRGTPAAIISGRFHNTLADVCVSIARRVGNRRVVLSGGCFQNKFLTKRVLDRLRGEDFDVFWHERVPPNDGGIALGQAVVALHRLREPSSEPPPPDDFARPLPSVMKNVPELQRESPSPNPSPKGMGKH